MRTRDVAGLIHVLDHAQLDAVAFALDLLGLLLRFGADAHIRTRPQRGFAASVVQQQAGAVLGVVRVSAHLLIQSVDHMFDRIHLHHTRMREQLIVAEQRGRAPDTAVHTPHQRACTTLQCAQTALQSPDRTTGIMLRFDVTQRAHDLVEQALAGLGLQIVRGAVLGRIRLDRRAHARQTVLDVLLLPVERVDLQLHVALRIDFAGALLQPRDAFRIRIDDHEHRTSIFLRDASRQFLDGPAQHFDGDFRHFRRIVFIAIRREQRQQEIRQQQCHYYHTAGDEDQLVTHREIRSRRKRVRNGEHQ